MKRTVAVIVIRWIAFMLMAAMLAACASDNGMKETRGEGIKRTYHEPYANVFTATLSAATERKLSVVDADQKRGTILLTSSRSLSSLGGERIAVFVTRLDDNTTNIEVVVHAKVPGISIAPDWADLLFGEIEEDLTEQRLSK
jgi:hypothetical protein